MVLFKDFSVTGFQYLLIPLQEMKMLIPFSNSFVPLSFVFFICMNANIFYSFPFTTIAMKSEVSCPESCICVYFL